ncbi:hypothetical protein Bcop_1594 [Bacteroides coprosuis DSM 18011]|uniref:Uncharacterized protein n=1 Tax=Bacteroides coprosuis DSM 18011 TaxID=679937 RepID=F3ZQJ1_9BACE|nr:MULTISPECIES: hypothetical protein [Bacteroides]EGJ71786.1 hypothetical protein Bcop_1594 [Bacteroides coprosuis DSM 18011]
MKNKYIRALDLPFYVLIAVFLTSVIAKNNFLEGNVLFLAVVLVVLYLLRLSVLLYKSHKEE